MGQVQSIQANGKILISGEYLVMHGAVALAVPLLLGQKLSMVPSDEPGKLIWEAFDPAGQWFSCVIALPGLDAISSAKPEIAERLVNLLRAARSLNPLFLQQGSGIKVQTHLDFRQEWGFGSSSTLTALIADWACADPVQLHRLVSKGSGYDIACARSETPVLYQVSRTIPRAEAVSFDPPFAENMHLVYLGAKQNSEAEVDAFLQKPAKDFREEAAQITSISRALAVETDQQKFADLLNEHEIIVGKVLGRQPVKNVLFPDFNGTIKSLGAWGGDFVLALSPAGSPYINNYFRQKSYGVILPFRSVARCLSNDSVLKS